MSKSVLYDSTLCVGCRACESACAEKWGLSYDEKIGAKERLSEYKLTTVVTRGDKFVRRMCMHCAEPTCVSVCPVGAFEKTSLGPVIYQEDRCIGCRYCIAACPFQVPVYEWSKNLPKVKKCDMCYERVRAGKPTSCSEACPTNATITGDYEAMVREARRRITENPKQYHPKIYGLREVGGTSVLFLSSVPFEQLGLNTGLPLEPLPQLTRQVLSFVPDVVGIGSVLLGGVYWITHRRDEVAAVEGQRPAKKEVRG